ncbi:MAG: hypothetical protein EAZ08_05755 [Cytophagales bacterium]|nr:MAG: hypothetical protein EAZ08_05755 [Cytophagales bacterium]
MTKILLIFIISFLCYYSNSYSQTQQQKTNETALLYMDSRIQQNPANAELYLQRAMAHLYTGQYTRAKNDFDTIITLRKGDAEMYYLRGLAKENNKQYQEAWSDFDEAVLISNANPNAYYFMGRGNASYKLGFYPQAIKDLEKANKILPENTEIEQILKIAKAKIDTSMHLADTSLVALDSTNQRYEINDNALRYFDNLIQKNTKNFELFASRAMAYFFIGRYVDAIKDFDSAIKLQAIASKASPRAGGGSAKLRAVSPDWYYFRAIAKETDGLFKESLQDLGRAIQLAAAKPNYFHFMLRGFANYNLSKYKEAIADLEKAKMLSKDNAEVVALLEKAKAKDKGGDDALNQVLIKELHSYISTHKFESITEGRNYYDSLKKLDLSAVGLEQAVAPLRKKLIKDIYGEAPKLAQLDQIKYLFQEEKWLLPEGMEQYFAYLDDSENHFRGEIKLNHVTYFFTVIRDSVAQHKYDLKVEKLNIGEEMVEFAYTTVIFTNQIESKDTITIKTHCSTNISGTNIWRFSPKDYLEVVYSKNANEIQEKAVGKMTEATMPSPAIAKSKLLEKESSKEFSPKEAIRKAVHILLIAYENIIPKT